MEGVTGSSPVAPTRFLRGMNMVVLFETYNLADIAFLKSLLDAHKITYIVDNEAFAALSPLSGVPMVLKVTAEQLDETKELLKDFQGGYFDQGKT